MLLRVEDGRWAKAMNAGAVCDRPKEVVEVEVDVDVDVVDVDVDVVVVEVEVDVDVDVVDVDVDVVEELEDSLDEDDELVRRVLRRRTLAASLRCSPVGCG